MLAGKMTAGEIIAFQMLLGNLYGPIQRFADVNVTIQNSITNIERIFEVLDEKPAITESENALSMPRCDGHIVFIDVSYTYSTRNVTQQSADGAVNPDLIEREKAPKRFSGSRRMSAPSRRRLRSKKGRG
ncbi:hypothetical protein PAAL109150_12535 [Paenibacillus alkaliterrae]